MDSKYCARCSFYIEKEKLAYEAEIRMMQDRLTAAESELRKRSSRLDLEYASHTKTKLDLEDMALERDQLRAQLEAAKSQEPIYEIKLGGGWISVEKARWEIEADWYRRIMYAAPILPQQATPAESVHGEASLESAIHRPECFDFAMSFLGDPEESIIRDYVLSLEKSAISKVEQVRGVGEPVYLVATGEHYGQHESYTLHDDPPALCDYEKLYRKPVPNKADVPDEPTEEMLEIGVDTLQRGFALFGENFTQIVNNVWEDMYAAALPPLKDE